MRDWLIIKMIPVWMSWVKEIRLWRLSLLILFCVTFASCEKEMPTPLGHDFEIDARLDIDNNGYYNLEL